MMRRKNQVSVHLRKKVCEKRFYVFESWNTHRKRERHEIKITSKKFPFSSLIFVLFCFVLFSDEIKKQLIK
jgi:hypothetical protein